MSDRIVLMLRPTAVNNVIRIFTIDLLNPLVPPCLFACKYYNQNTAKRLGFKNNNFC